MHSVGDAWKYMLTMTAGVGLVMILRWYWWRINAWSEISALAISAVAGSALYAFNVIAGDDPNATAKRLLITVAITTVGWIAVTFATQPETEATLVRFFERVRPDDFGWKRIARLAAPAPKGESLGLALVDWLAGLGLVFGTLFAIGDFVLAEPLPGTGFAILALVCGAVIARSLNSATVRTVAALRTRADARDAAADRARRRRQGAHQREGRRLVRTRGHAAYARTQSETVARRRRRRGHANRFARASRVARFVDRHARRGDARATCVLQSDRYRERKIHCLSRKNAL